MGTSDNFHPCQFYLLGSNKVLQNGPISYLKQRAPLPVHSLPQDLGERSLKRQERKLAWGQSKILALSSP